MSETRSVVIPANLLRIIRFQARDVGDLLTLRETCEQYREFIDGDYLVDLWAKFLNKNVKYVERAFKTGNDYIVKKALAAAEWAELNPGVLPTFFGGRCDLPAILRFQFAKFFISNTFQAIDDIMVSFDDRKYINSIDHSDRSCADTPLWFSCREGNYRRASFLLENGADPNYCGVFTRLISWAAELNIGELKNPELRRLVRLFVEKGVNIQHVISVLIEIIEDYDFVKFLIDLTKVDLNIIPKEKPYVILTMAIARKVSIEVIKLLIDNGANAKLYHNGKTPLSEAFEIIDTDDIRIDVVLLLVENGALIEPTTELIADRGDTRHIEKCRFNIAKFLEYVYNIPNKSEQTKDDIRKVVEIVLDQSREHINDHYEDKNVFMRVPDLLTLKLLVENLTKYEFELLEEQDENGYSLMAYLYSRKKFDCIEYLVGFSSEDRTIASIGEMFNIVGHDDPEYVDMRQKVDSLISPLVPRGSLEPFAETTKLIEWYNDVNISDDLYEYIFNTKATIDLISVYSAVNRERQIGAVG